MHHRRPLASLVAAGEEAAQVQLALAVKLAFAPLMRFAYRNDPALAGQLLYQQAHPRDPAARAEVQRQLRARRQRQAVQ